MQEVTVKDICNTFGYNLVNLAKEIGCSISLLSKIQNDKECVTENTQEKFQKVFPDFKLVNGTYKYKDLYKKALEDLKEANKTIDSLENQLMVARTKLETIYNIAKEEV